jgi:hypothetical protein
MGLFLRQKNHGDENVSIAARLNNEKHATGTMSLIEPVEDLQTSQRPRK